MTTKQLCLWCRILPSSVGLLCVWQRLIQVYQVKPNLVRPCRIRYITISLKMAVLTIRVVSHRSASDQSCLKSTKVGHLQFNPLEPWLFFFYHKVHLCHALSLRTVWKNFHIGRFSGKMLLIFSKKIFGNLLEALNRW